jgi:hypothetical protein
MLVPALPDPPDDECDDGDGCDCGCGDGSGGVFDLDVGLAGEVAGEDDGKSQTMPPAALKARNLR